MRTSLSDRPSPTAELRAVVGWLSDWHRTRPRRTAALAVVMAAGAIVGIVHWLPVDRPLPHRPASHRVAASPVPGTPVTSVPSDRSAASATARRFALAWTTDDRAGMDASATPALFARLETTPAAPAGPPASASVGRVIDERIAAQSARVLVTLRLTWPAHDGHGTASTGTTTGTLSLALTLARQHGGWRVTGAGAT
jgi:hypothetical protein